MFSKHVKQNQKSGLSGYNNEIRPKRSAAMKAILKTKFFQKAKYKTDKL